MPRYVGDRAETAAGDIPNAAWEAGMEVTGDGLRGGIQERTAKPYRPPLLTLVL